MRDRRPMGDPWLSEATEAEMRAEIMANMARNLSRKPEKALGVDMIDRAIDVDMAALTGTRRRGSAPPSRRATGNSRRNRNRKSVRASKS